MACTGLQPRRMDYDWWQLIGYAGTAASGLALLAKAKLAGELGKVPWPSAPLAHCTRSLPRRPVAAVGTG